VSREGEEDPALEELLRRGPHPAPDPLRREAARAAFLSGASRAAPGPRMGAPVPSDLELYLASQPVAPPARAEFRGELRKAFVLSAPKAALPAAPPRSRLMRFGVPLLAAAAIVAVTVLFPEPERWRVRSAAPVRFAGAEYAPGDAQELAVDLEGSGTFETLEAPALFDLGGKMELELRPGSELVFPLLPELDGVGTVWFELARGEAYLKTADGYPGNPVRIKTPQAEVALHGTTLGVLVSPGGTCVCVAEGQVTVESGQLVDGHMDVAAGGSCFVFDDPARGGDWCAFPTDAADENYAHVHDLLAFQVAAAPAR